MAHAAVMRIAKMRVITVSGLLLEGDEVLSLQSRIRAPKSGHQSKPNEPFTTSCPGDRVDGRELEEAGPWESGG